MQSYSNTGTCFSMLVEETFSKWIMFFPKKWNYEFSPHIRWGNSLCIMTELIIFHNEIKWLICSVKLLLLKWDVNVLNSYTDYCCCIITAAAASASAAAAAATTTTTTPPPTTTTTTHLQICLTVYIYYTLRWHGNPIVRSVFQL